MPEFSGATVATLIVALLALAGTIYANVSARRNRREAEANTNRSPTPPTTQQVWDRLDRVERQLAAMVRIVEQVADQWPADHPGPVIAPEDLGILEDTWVPEKWARRRRRPA